MKIRENEVENHLPFPQKTGERFCCRLPRVCGHMDVVGLRPGFALYLTDYAPTTPIVMASDSWPAGFGWIFFLSGKIKYHHYSLDREMEMTTGMNRLAFQPGTSGKARLFPGTPIRVVTLTMTPECFTTSLEQDMRLLPPCFRRAAQVQGNQGCFTLGKNTPRIQTTLGYLVEALSQPHTPRLLLEGLALELIGLQFGQLTGNRKIPVPLPPDIRERIDAARDTLVRQMDESPSLVDLARQVGLTPNRLSSGFKSIYGTTPFAHLREVRLNHARQLLEQNQMNVTEAALSVGYNSLSHFSKAFFRAFGILPGQVIPGRNRES